MMPSESTNIRYLEMFQAVMKSRNVTEAAQELNVSQPAVSHAIKMLEAHVGFQLFSRAGGRFTPTPEAVLLLPEAERLFAQLGGFSFRVSELRAKRGGFLTVAAVPSCATSLLPVAFAAFRQRRPEVECSIQIHTVSAMTALVKQEAVDLGFGFAPYGDGAVTAEPLLETQLVACMRRDNPLAKESVITLEHLSSGMAVVPSRGNVPGQILRETIDRQRLRELRPVEVNHAGLAIGFVRKSGGIGLMEPLSLDPSLAPDMVLRPFSPAVPMTLSAFYSRHRPAHALMLEFISDLRNAAVDEAIRLTAIGLTATMVAG